MRPIAAILLLSLGTSAYAVPVQAIHEEESSASSFRTIVHSSWKVGEKLSYKLHFGLIDAGVAEFKVEPTTRTVKGRELIHIVCEGKSISAFDWFYKVRDRYESYVDKLGVFPWVFVRRVDEGGFKFNQDYTFYQHKNQVDNGAGKQFNVPENIQDMISAFYYARTMDLSDAKIDQVYHIKCFVDDEIHDLGVKYKGIEVVKIRAGKFRCMKFQPLVIKGRIFKKEDDLTVYVTADANRIPILVKAEVMFGSVKMEVTKYEGLANKISKVD
jgi:hypothetical protein